MPASWPAPDGSSSDRHAEALQLGAERGADLLGHQRRLGANRRFDARAPPRGGRAARRPGRGHPRSGRRSRGSTFVPPGSTESRPTVATAPSIPLRDVTRPKHELGRCDERVLAAVHRRRSGVPRRAREAPAAANVADDRGHDAERRVGAEERRALLDVQLDVCVGQDAGRDTRPAAGAAPLLVPEDDDAEPGQAERLDRLEPGDDAERPVEAAGAGDRVEVRARPDLALAARDPPDQVARRRRPPPRARPRGTTPPPARAPRPPPASSRSGRRSRPARPGARRSSFAEGTTARAAVLAFSGSAQRAKHEPAGNREHRREPVGEAPGARGDDGREGERSCRRRRATSTVCWTPSAAPLRARPASSATAAKATPFQAIVSDPATTNAGTSRTQRRVQQAGGDGERDAHRDSDSGERDRARPQLVRPAARADPQHHRRRPGRRRAPRPPRPCPASVRRAGRGRRS